MPGQRTRAANVPRRSTVRAKISLIAKESPNGAPRVGDGAAPRQPLINLSVYGASHQDSNELPPYDRFGGLVARFSQIAGYTCILSKSPLGLRTVTICEIAMPVLI